MRHWLLAFFFVVGMVNLGIAAKPKSSDDAKPTEGKMAVEIEAKSKMKKEKQKVFKKSTKAEKQVKKKTAKIKKANSKKSRKAASQQKTQKITKKKSSKKGGKKIKQADAKWNHACTELLDTSVDSTLKLEKSLTRRKKKISPEEFEGKVQNEMLVVQLNAWVCAISSQFEENQKGASIEEEFLKDYAQRVQSRNL